MEKTKNRIEVKQDIVDGDVGLDDSYLDRKNHKLRITTWIDGDVYDELNRRADAGEAKGKYQKLMNELLKEALFGKQSASSGEGVDLSMSELQQIKDILKTFPKVARGKKPAKTSIPTPIRKGMAQTPQLYRNGKRPATATKKKGIRD